MDLLSHRRKRGLSQQQLALALGVKSKGYISSVESAAFPANLRFALKVEAWSNGQVPAGDLVTPEDAALLASHCALHAARAGGAAA